MASPVSIIGAGRVGTAIAVSLKDAGFDIVGVASRRLDTAELLARRVGCSRFSQEPSEVVIDSEIVFITTPDREIVGVCKKITPFIKKGTLVIHTSGALPSKILDSAKKRRALCLSMHPCQSFSDVLTAPERLRGCYFCLEGDDEAVRRGRLLAKAMHCYSFVLESSDKTLYHIACSVASNYFVVLIERAVSVLEKIGVERERALRVIVPLLRGTLQNVVELGVKEALTGPIERGEIETVKEESEIVKTQFPELKGVYTILGKEALRIAMEKGRISPEVKRKLLEILG